MTSNVGLDAPVAIPLSAGALEVPVNPIDMTFWSDVRRRFFRNKLAVTGLAVLSFLLLAAIFGPFVLRGNFESAVNGEQLRRLGTKGHLLGTDDLGRDMARRIVRGLRVSFALAAAVTFMGTIIGMALGGIAGYLGGFIDTIISRAIDALYAVPYVIVGVAFLAVFGRSFWTVVGTIVAVGWIGTARLFRSSVLQVRNLDYVEAARATGASTKRILMRHILPNALPPIIVTIAFGIAGAVLAETIYSFLGIGFQEPTPAIGVMIASARGQFQQAPHVLLVPATALMLLTLSVVLVGDALRDALDPKLRGAT
jgi:ABC-type dipeptide/oligopeptide/nickel transport system permease subunit